MISEEILLSFSESEINTYRQQCEYHYFELPETEDLLDVYSCHSEPHVLEVMAQCREMYESLMPFLEAVVPDIRSSENLDNLLVAAKFHDISMGGSKKELLLLDAADSIHEWLYSEQMKSARDLRKRGKELIVLAKDSGLTKGRYSELEALLSMPGLRRESCEQLEDALTLYHDEIKSFIRKHHAPAGGNWVFEHAAEVLERYGTELDLKLITSLIMLHSTSSTAVKTISCAGDEKERLTRNIIKDFMQPRLTVYEMQEVLSETYYKRMILLASILRLADTRRQGDRLQTIDKRELFYRIEPDGTVDLYRKMPWGPDRITKRLTHSILLSEACTKFGKITVKRNTAGWIMIHPIQLADSQNQEICDMFEKYRLHSYVKEVDTGAFAKSAKLSHVFYVVLKGICDKNEAERLEVEWRERWRSGDEMQQRYADAIKVGVLER